MRTILTIASTTLIAAATLMLVWRPVLGFGLALIGFCVNLWRLNRASKPSLERILPTRALSPVRPSIAMESAVPQDDAVQATPTPSVTAEPEPAPELSVLQEPSLSDAPANDHTPVEQESKPDSSFPSDLMARVLVAGWQASARDNVLFCAHNGARLALLHVGEDGPKAEDLAAASRLKIRYKTDFVAVLSLAKPEPQLVARAVELGVQFVNIGRLEAYLAMAGSFKPAATAAERRAEA